MKLHGRKGLVLPVDNVNTLTAADKDLNNNRANNIIIILHFCVQKMYAGIFYQSAL